MRLRAIIADCKAFLALFTVIRSSVKRCIMMLSPKLVRVISLAASNSLVQMHDGAQVWASASPQTLFCDFKCESQMDNCVFMELLDLPSLLHALKVCDRATAGTANGATLKLLQKDEAQMLVVSCNQLGVGTRSGLHDFHQEVMVRVLSDFEVSHMQQPRFADKHVVTLPPLHELQPLFERMRAIRALHLTIEVRVSPHAKTGAGASAADEGPLVGMLSLMGQSAGLTLAALFRNVQVERKAAPAGAVGAAAVQQQQQAAAATAAAHEDGAVGGGGAAAVAQHQQQQQQQSLRAVIDLRRFYQFLAVREAGPETVVTMYLMPDKAIALRAQLANGTVSTISYIPSLAAGALM
jgi:hypothetical protein